MRAERRCAHNPRSNWDSTRHGRQHRRLDCIRLRCRGKDHSRPFRMKKAVGIIPAQPLLHRVWERCMRAKNLDSIIIATEDMRIAKAAFDWGAEVALTSQRH